MIRSTKFTLITALFLFGSLISCNNDETSISDDILDETTFAENVFEQLSADVDDVTFDADNIGGRTSDGDVEGYKKPMHRFGYSGCATITKESPDDADFPIVITIDFGEGCESYFQQVIKSGKIIITLTGRMKDAGSERIVKFEEFYVNGNHIEGVRTTTNNGDGSFSCTLEGGKITTSDGEVITRDSKRIRTLVRGGDTDDRWDDVYEITGSATGMVNDIPYEKVITKALIRSKDCFWITSGTIETTMGDTLIITDFGDGTCDNIATREIDGEIEEFTMGCHMRRFKHHIRHWLTK